MCVHASTFIASSSSVHFCRSLWACHLSRTTHKHRLWHSTTPSLPLSLQDKRVAGEQEKSVNAEAVKIGKEAEEANAIASQVQSELDKALPALQAAEDALNVLTKKDMSELKAYAKPPALVELTLNAVMTVFSYGGVQVGVSIKVFEKVPGFNKPFNKLTSNAVMTVTGGCQP
eukprot:1162101-Pelagomonas_calceolata.AAC.14